MDGILVINKPLGLTSHQCVNYVRKVFNTKKVGHSGTLDPEASGVLVLGINKGTKLLHYLNQDVKRYRFTLRLGQTTDTLDHTGKIIDEKPLENITDFDDILTRFIGDYNQVPPAYSAVKVKGKKLYQYARNNETIPKLDARYIQIFDLKRISDFVSQEKAVDVDCDVFASKGLYIRVLASDIASALNTVGHTAMIHRTQAGAFTIEDAVNLSETITDALIPMHHALKDMPKYIVSNKEKDAIRHGQKMTLNHHAERLQCIDENGQLIAIYERKDHRYKAKNVFI